MADTKNWNQMTKMAGSLQPFFWSCSYLQTCLLCNSVDLPTGSHKPLIIIDNVNVKLSTSLHFLRLGAHQLITDDNDQQMFCFLQFG